MKAADIRRWEMQALDKLLGRLLDEASLARGREDGTAARAWEREARAAIKLRDKVARGRKKP